MTGGKWPELVWDDWRGPCDALHRWLQIVGKVRLAFAPMLNHYWQATYYVTSRGFTTSPIPYGERVFQVDFDFLDSELRIETSSGERVALELRSQAVSAFFAEFMAALRSLGIEVEMQAFPTEMADAIPFAQDDEHRDYDPDCALRHWRAFVQADRVFKIFRGRFIGKASPVHVFWGSFDLAATRFSGRRAPLHPGGFPHLADEVIQESYSHEVSSAGFWTGGSGIDEAAFYSYAYPEPPGYSDYGGMPEGTLYHPGLREFILPYRLVREADDPDALLLRFLQRTYEAAADLGKWDRDALERL